MSCSRRENITKYQQEGLVPFVSKYYSDYLCSYKSKYECEEANGRMKRLSAVYRVVAKLF